MASVSLKGSFLLGGTKKLSPIFSQAGQGLPAKWAVKVGGCTLGDSGPKPLFLEPHNLAGDLAAMLMPGTPK